METMVPIYRKETLKSRTPVREQFLSCDLLSLFLVYLKVFQRYIWSILHIFAEKYSRDFKPDERF